MFELKKTNVVHGGISIIIEGNVFKRKEKVNLHKSNTLLLKDYQYARGYS